MSVLAGPFAAVAALLGVAGMAKAIRPGSAAASLRAAGLPDAVWAVRTLGAVEVTVAALALTLGDRASAVLLAATYVGFAAFVLRLLGRRTAVGCGCFGQAEAPVGSTHVVANVAMAAVAAAASAWPPGPLLDTMADQPVAGVPFVALTALCASLAYLLLTVLPELQAAIARPEAHR